jgi:hypothetical protein
MLQKPHSRVSGTIERKVTEANPVAWGGIESEVAGLLLKRNIY